MKIQSLSNSAFQSFYQQRQQYKNKLSNVNENRTAKKFLPAGLALMGAVLPILAINLAKGKGANLVDTFKNSAKASDKIKSAFNLFEMNNYGDLLASTTGAIAGGLVGGIIGDKNSENRKEKYKEGIFEFLNCMIPTTFVAVAELVSKKTGKLKSAPAKAAIIASSVAGGMFIANKTSNKINEKTFDKNTENKEKGKFKISDCFVHMDDILGLLVLARVPFAKVIHADKILPLLYARSGYEAGSASLNDNKKPKNEKCDKI